MQPVGTKTAVVVCDMWERHWCAAATVRLGLLAQRIEGFLAHARRQGVTVVHAASEVTGYYAGHREREKMRAMGEGYGGELYGKADKLDLGRFPLDDLAGGCSCEPKCRQAPVWKRQHPTIRIPESDYISVDEGEIERLFEAMGIETVVYVGVHGNFCLLERPFGMINQGLRRGREVIVVGELTECIYDARVNGGIKQAEADRRVLRFIEERVGRVMRGPEVLGGLG